MTARINRNLVTQVNSDSGSLTTLTTVVHKFSEKGEYHGVVLQGNKQTVGIFTIVVTGKVPGRSAEDQSKHVTKAEIDLQLIHSNMGSKTPENRFVIEEDGYAVFRVPSGAAGGYAVEVFKAGELGQGPKVFDSQKLNSEDNLAIVVLRPGVYSLVNALESTHKSEAEVVVAYPEKNLRSAEPVRIRCSKGGMTPDKIKCLPMQGLVFSFETTSRILMNLVTPDDKRRIPRSLVAANATAKKRTDDTKRNKVSRRIECSHFGRRLTTRP